MKRGPFFVFVLLFFAVGFGLRVVSQSWSGGTTPYVRQKTADYIATSANETDRLHLIVAQNSLELTGYLEVTIRQSNGTLKVKRIPITGDVSTGGVPAAITIPSSEMGVSDLSLGCFFDRSLNLVLFGDNRRRFPRFMRRVLKQ